MRKTMVLSLALLLAACTTSGPQKLLDEMADALEKHDGPAFLAHIDMRAYSTNYLANITQNSSALSSIGAISKMFGLDNILGNVFGSGSIDDLIGNVVDMQGRLSSQFNRGVSSGELMAECRRAETPDCPWVPQALRKARIIELGPEAAIAQVTTPTSLTSWLSLKKINGQWLITGQAVLEGTAREFATQEATPTGQKAPATPI